MSFESQKEFAKRISTPPNKEMGKVECLIKAYNMKNSTMNTKRRRKNSSQKFFDINIVTLQFKYVFRKSYSI